MKRHRVFLVLDKGEIELPNHPGALENIDYTNVRIRVVYWWQQ